MQRKCRRFELITVVEVMYFEHVFDCFLHSKIIRTLQFIYGPVLIYILEQTEGAIKNEQSREKGNIGHCNVYVLYYMLAMYVNGIIFGY
jgi:hypothetical protein